MNQTLSDNQAKVASAFKAAMAKMAVLGQDTSKMIDCSDVIPVPKPFTGQAVFPPSLSNANVEQAVCLFSSNQIRGMLITFA